MLSRRNGVLYAFITVKLQNIKNAISLPFDVR